MTQPRTGPSDMQLIGGMAAGRLDALESFYDRFAADAYGTALFAHADPRIAEDRLRLGFLEAWRGAAEYDSATASVRDWLVGLVLGERLVGGGPAAEPMTPPETLRARVLAGAYADLAERRHPASPRPSAPAGAPRVITLDGEAVEIRDGAPVTPDSVFDVRVGAARRTITLVAAVVVFVVGAWGFLMNQQVTGLQAYQDVVEAVVVLAGEEGSATAPMRAPGGATTGLAVVGPDGSVGLLLHDLEPTAGSQVYVAWVRPAGGGAWAPVSEFTVARDRAAAVRGTAPASVSAPVDVQVTREGGPGATVPAGSIAAAATVEPASP